MEIIEDFLQSIIPIDTELWLAFFIIPGAVTLVLQLLLCLLSHKTWVKLIPLYIAAVLCLGVAANVLFEIPLLARYIGGFVSLLIFGTCLTIAAVSLLDWLIYLVIYLIRTRRRRVRKHI